MDLDNSLNEPINNISEKPLQVIPPNRRFPPIFFILSAILLLILGVIGFIWIRSDVVIGTKPHRSILSPTPSLSEHKIIGDYTISIKESSNNSKQTDIYLKDTQSGKEDFFISLTDLNKRHYHNADFKGGYVYIIKRIGYDEFTTTNNDWTDELWRYDGQKHGKKIFSNKGLDFRVANDGRFIAIIGSGSKNVVGENLTLIRSTGEIIKQYLPETFGVENVGAMEWYDHSFWFSDRFGPSISTIIKLNVETLKSTIYKLPDFIGPEYALNPAREKIAFSTFPALFDVESQKDFDQSGKEIVLEVYDLNSKKKETIARSITKRFMPHWINDITLEYDNPKGEGTRKKTF